MLIPGLPARVLGVAITERYKRPVKVKVLVFKMDTIDSMVPKTDTSSIMADEIITSGQLVSKTPTSVVMVSISSTSD
jgi:hypothetical protein